MTAMDEGIEQVLWPVVRGETVTEAALAPLADRLSQSPLTTVSLPESLERLRQHYPTIQHLCCTEMGWSSVPLLTLWRLWLPLAEDIARIRHTADRPIVQGFLGGQGTGKTTLCRILTVLLNQMGYQVASVSLDDIYKTFGDRQQLQQTDPRLRWRGPPGTHDIDTGLEVMRQVKSGSDDPVWLPRFDKSLHQGQGDRINPVPVQNIDILLFEGWFVGVRPIDPARLDAAPPPVVSAADQAFAQDCNTRLRDYVPLWDELDSLIFLRPVDYRLSQTWRKQAEQEMMRQGRSGMSDAEIEAFVEYFWKALHPELFWAALEGDRQHVNWIIDIHPDHTPGTIYRPNES